MQTVTSQQPPRPRGNYRWLMCGLLFVATTINYIDRQVIGILKPELQASLGWDENDFATIVFWFQVAYAAGFLFSGRLIDRIGSKAGLALSVAGWSVAEIGHAIVRTVTGFSFARFWLGLAEGGNFPAAIKSVSEWFPKQQRALATGIFNSGCNVAGLAAPCGALDRRPLGLAGGLRGHRRPGLCLARALDAALRAPPAPSPPFAGRAGLHPQRSARGLSQFSRAPRRSRGRRKWDCPFEWRPSCKYVMDGPSWSSANLGLLHGHVHDRAGGVVLSLLDPRFPAQHLRTGHGRPGLAAGSDFAHDLCGRHRRRMDFLDAAPSRLERRTRRARRPS